MIDFKAGLEKYIEAEVQRRVDARLKKVLDELGVPRGRVGHHGGGRAGANAVDAVISPPKKRRRPVSAETRAKMKAAWVRRKAAGQPAAPVKEP